MMDLIYLIQPNFPSCDQSSWGHRFGDRPLGMRTLHVSLTVIRASQIRHSAVWAWSRFPCLRFEFLK